MTKRKRKRRAKGVSVCAKDLRTLAKRTLNGPKCERVVAAAAVAVAANEQH